LFLNNALNDSRGLAFLSEREGKTIRAIQDGDRAIINDSVYLHDGDKFCLTKEHLSDILVAS
jgi:hypothetical protein